MRRRTNAQVPIGDFLPAIRKGVRYDILKTYHGLVREFYKDLELMLEKIKKITSNHNKLVKDKFK
jgi:hypothetical protein